MDETHGGGAAPDPSMEDILASIRRILSEDEAAVADPTPHVNVPRLEAGAGPAPEYGPEPADFDDDVLELDPAMMTVAATQPSVVQAPDSHVPDVNASPPITELIGMNDIHNETAPHEGEHAMQTPATHDALLAPETATATASSVGSLVRTLANERNTPVYHGGPTIEDLLRDEMRPLIKGWLDAHLPQMVERLVRIEIERVVTRAAL